MSTLMTGIIPTRVNGSDVFDPVKIFDELDSFELTMVAIEMVIFVPTIFGNTLILWSIRRFQWLQTPLNALVGNLAVSDMLIGILITPIHVLGAFLELYKFRIMCLTNLTVLVTLLLVSLLSMLAISVERYYSVAFPWKHRASKRQLFVKIFIPICWVLVIGFACIPAFGWNNYTDKVNYRSCQLYLIWPDTMKYILNGSIVFIIASNVILFILILNIALAKRPTTYTNEPEVRMRVNRTLAKTYMVMAVSAVFILCWAPFCAISLFTFMVDIEDLKIAQSWTLNLGLLNSGLNWLIYGLKNEKFRKAFRIILCTCKSSERPTSTESSIEISAN